MKGILKLIPVEKPEEGMKVVVDLISMEGKELEIATIYKIEKRDTFMNNGYTITLKNGDFYKKSELQQLVVEYKIINPKVEPGTNIVRSANIPSIEYHILPLHTDDWEQGLEMLGKEVEFEHHWKTPATMGFAKLIFPSFFTTVNTSTSNNRRNLFPSATKATDEFLNIPSPILYTEEEVKDFAVRYSYFIGKELDPVVHIDRWWEENKKK